MVKLPSSIFHNFIGFERIAGGTNRYGRLPEVDPVILEMFGKTQIEVSGTTAFHEHPVVLMVANFMQKVHTWDWQNRPVHRTIFPGLNGGISPSQFDIEGMNDSVYKNEGAFGLLAKCFYNGYSDYSGKLNDGRFNEEISLLNTSFKQDATHLYAEYLRHAYSMSPSHEYVVQYQDLLLSKAYRTLKQAQIASGSWPNPDMEVFVHFVKLLACGASTAEVDAIYGSLISGVYALDPGAFPSIGPGKWKLYRGWLASDYLDWVDLQAHNLQAEAWAPGATGGSIVRLVAIFANWFDYWKPSGGSCFSEDTHIVLADGNTKEISKIQEGDRVLSYVFRGGVRSSSTVTVAFVSKPKRSQRPLYSYHDAPRVKFTDTHPLVADGSDLHSRNLVLKFVNPELASAMNSSWQCIPSTRIPQNAVHRHDGKLSHPDEVLYDLVFDINSHNYDNVDSGPIFFIAADPNGKMLEAASEAPIFHWYPYEMKFFETTFTALLHDSCDIASIVSLVLNPNTVILAPWGEISKEAWTRFHLWNYSEEIPKGQSFPFSVDNVLFRNTQLDGGPHRQDIADAFESLSAQLGRRLHAEILTGWTYTPAVTSKKRSSGIIVLILHTLSFLGHTVTSKQPSETHRKMKLKLIQNREPIRVVDVVASRKGSQTLEIHSVLSLQEHPHELDDDGRRLWKIQLEIQDPVAEVSYRGSGHLHEDVLTIVGLGQTAGDQQAIIDAKIVKVSHEALHEQASWNKTKALAFAEALGKSFATRLANEYTQKSILRVEEDNIGSA